MTTQLRSTTFPLLNWNKLNLPKRELCDTLQMRLAANWIFRVRLCMIQIIEVGFSVWEFLSPYKSLLKLVYPCMFIKDIAMPWTWNDANISRRGAPCLWKRNYTILGQTTWISENKGTQNECNPSILLEWLVSTWKTILPLYRSLKLWLHIYPSAPSNTTIFYIKMFKQGLHSTFKSSDRAWVPLTHVMKNWLAEVISKYH